MPQHLGQFPREETGGDAGRVALGKSARLMRAIARGIELLKILVIAVLVAGLAAAGLLLWAAHHTGSFGAGLAYLRGDCVYALSAGPIRAATGSLTNQGSSAISFLNLSDEPLRIVGFNNPCMCITIKGLPAIIGPHEWAILRVESILRTDGPQTVPVMFLTDRREQGVVPIDFQILAAPKAAS